jgi:flotillin
MTEIFSFGTIGVVATIVLLILFVLTMLTRQYRRCPSNRVLVVYGKVAGQRAAKCLHGGGTFVVPLLQSFAYLNLEPMTIEIDLAAALSKKNIRVNVPSTFTIGISTHPDVMNNAAERLLGLGEREIAAQARDIILGQMRLVIATLSIEEINQDREKFLDLVNKNVSSEVNKIGLELINVNVRDITDESGYIEALGRKAASDAINQAKIEVAEAERAGAIGQTNADREMQVEVARLKAESVSGQKQAERDQRVRVAKFEAEGLSGEADARREQDIAVAAQAALAVQGKKQAEADQRVKVAELEAGAVRGENESKANIADYEASLAERRAEAKRRGEVAMANAARDVLLAEKAQELARLEKTQIAQQMIERQKIEIDAEAEAERLRRIARGEADAVLAKYTAEAEGVKKVLEAKAEGYENLLRVCGDRKDLAPALLLIEKLPDLVAEQVKAVQNLKIEKVTVWDSGANGHDGTGATANFLRGLIGALPPIHELANQAGIDLPAVLGKVTADREPPKIAD